MMQTLLTDLSKRCTVEPTDTDHSWGERFPGPDPRPLRQLALNELWSPPPSPPALDERPARTASPIKRRAFKRRSQ